MWEYGISFERPWYLLLLIGLPVIWRLAYHSLAGMGRVRWSLAMALRTGLYAALVLALAEISVVRTHDRMAVLYLVDRSLSIPAEQLQQMIGYVNQGLAEQRRPARDDLAGVISFGGTSAVDIAPISQAAWLAPRFETEVEREHTNLAGALRLAAAAFPPGAARRVVIVTDGNENLGDAAGAARELSSAGVGIDVVRVPGAGGQDVAVDKVVVPSDVRRAAPFDVRVVLRNDSDDPAREAVTLSGRLSVYRHSGEVHQLVADQPVQVPAGKQVFTFREQLDQPGFFTYEARFAPDNIRSDRFAGNNRGSAFAQLRGAGRVLLIVSADRSQEFDQLAALLRSEQVEVTVQPSDQLFTSLAELQAYDTVILANVPRAGDNDADSLAVFSDEQLQMLADNTRQLGGGLLMLGGPESFGAGGWAETVVEQAMPVDFRVRNSKVVASGALMLVIDSSGSMHGDKIQLSKVAALAAVKALGAEDEIGVVAFDTFAHWIVPMQKVGDRREAMRKIRSLTADGGTNMMPAMSDGFTSLAASNAAVKHMIVLSDGQTEPGPFQQLVQRMRQQRITVTAVAVGPDADVNLLQDIAMNGHGKFYRVLSPKAIPHIFMREARRISQPLVYEDPQGLAPQLVTTHEILSGLKEPIPPITGYLMTTAKEGPLVELLMTVPRPSGRTNPLLAAWQYGLGRTAVLTTDTGQRWAGSWQTWPGRNRLLTQLVRWTLRPSADAGQYQVTTQVEGQQVRVVLTAMDQASSFLNFLQPTMQVVDGDGESQSLTLRQQAPGRYVAEYDTTSAGTQLLAIKPAPGAPLVRVGVDVGYSDEFRHRDENLALLQELAALVPSGGSPGRLITMPSLATREIGITPVVDDAFRHDLRLERSSRPSWQLLLFLACGVLLVDVMNRRVAWYDQWVAPLAAWVTRPRTRTAVQEEPRLARLRERKAELRELQRSPALPEEEPTSTELPLATAELPPPTDRHQPSPAAELSADETDPFARLRAAKRAAHRPLDEE